MGLLDDLRAGSAEAEASGGTDFAPSWRWEQPGDGVEGIVVAVSSRVHDNHPDGYPIVTIRQADGTDIAVHCMATVLKNEVTDKRPRVGDEFAVVFDGQKTSGGGRKYNAFRIAMQPGKGEVPPAAPKTQEQNAGAGWARKQEPTTDVWGSNNPADVPF